MKTKNKTKKKTVKRIVDVDAPGVSQAILDIMADELTKRVLRDLFGPGDPWPAGTDGGYPEPTYLRYGGDIDFRQYVPKPFMWMTHGGDLLRLRDMPSPHIYYALRMVWNHSVPKNYRTPESIHSVKLYSDVPKWSKEYREAAIRELANELQRRVNIGKLDLTPTMKDGLRWINMATAVLQINGEWF